MPESVAHERGRDGLVIDKSLFLKSIEAEIDAGGSKALLAQTTAEFFTCSSTIGDQVQGSVANPDILVVVEEMMVEVRGK